MASAAPSTALAVADRSAAAIISAAGFSREQVDLIKSTVAVGATDMELALFLQISQHRRLDPIAKQIYFIKRWTRRQNAITGQWEDVSVGTIQTGIDGFRLIADRSKNSDGQDEPEYTYAANGTLEKATVRVYRKDVSRPYVGVARWSEYVVTDKNGKVGKMWESMPHTMLAKCAEALALRKAFPEDLGGMYINEEMGTPVTLEGEATVLPAASAPTGTVTRIDRKPASDVDASEAALDDFAASEATRGEGIPAEGATAAALRMWLGQRIGATGNAWSGKHMTAAIAEVSRALGLAAGVVTPKSLSDHLGAYRTAIAREIGGTAVADGAEPDPDPAPSGGAPAPTSTPAREEMASELQAKLDSEAVAMRDHVEQRLGELGLDHTTELVQDATAAVSDTIDHVVNYDWRKCSPRAQREILSLVLARVSENEP